MKHHFLHDMMSEALLCMGLSDPQA